jgi:hypothetical protein
MGAGGCFPEVTLFLSIIRNTNPRRMRKMDSVVRLRKREMHAGAKF